MDIKNENRASVIRIAGPVACCVEPAPRPGDEQLSGFSSWPVPGAVSDVTPWKVAPKVDTLFASDQPIVWSMARGRQGVSALLPDTGAACEI